MGNFNYQAVANTVASNLSNQHNAAAFGQFLNTALETYQKHLEQKKLDTLADTIMAADNAKTNQDYAVQTAKKATAVSSDDPDLQGTSQYNDDNPGPVFQYTDGSSPGSPPTASQEEAHNVGLRTAAYPNGFSFEPGTAPDAPGTLPATGGYAGLQMRMLMGHLRNQDALASAKTSHLMDLVRNGGSSSTSAPADPNSLAGQRLALAKTMEARRATAAAGRASAAGAAVKQQFDSTQKLNSDLQFKYGHDYGEFRDAGKDDIVPQNGGVLYRLGGDKKGPDGRMLPKQEVFVSQADADQMNTRVNGLLSGKPVVLNAGQVYRQHIGAGGSATGSSAGDPLTEARAAIAAGADPEQVKKRLQANGIDTSTL